MNAKKGLRWIISSLLVLSIAILSAFYAFGSSATSHPVSVIDGRLLDVTDSSLIINLTEVRLVEYADSGSMEPLLFAGATGIEVPVKSPEDLHVGDIVSYEAPWIKGLVTHRIIEMGVDGDGRYYLLKGDANGSEDPGKVRIFQIKFKLVGVLY